MDKLSCKNRTLTIEIMNMETLNVDIKFTNYHTEQNQWRFDFSGPKDIARSPIWRKEWDSTTIFRLAISMTT